MQNLTYISPIKLLFLFFIITNNNVGDDSV